MTTHSVEGHGARRLAALGVVALSLALGAALWTTGPTPPGAPWAPWAPSFLRGFALAWVCYVVAALMVSRTGISVSRQGLSSRWLLVWIIVAAAGMRLIALERTHLTSSDAYRYLWDGRVANAGINPFLYPPNAPELRARRDANWWKINFRRIPTIYPPAAQLLFAGLARVRDDDLRALQWAFAFLDMGSVLALVALLRRTSRPPEHVIWYAWCPLAITEVTAGAHVDAFALLLFLCALLATDRARGRPGLLSGCLLAASVMAKGYAILTLPFFAKRGGWRFPSAFAATCALLLLPYLSAGPRLFDGFRAYVSAWETNASIFLLLESLLTKVTGSHFGLARLLTTGLVLAAIAALFRQQQPGLRWLSGASFAAFGAQLLFGAPTLPWYVLWIAPALCWWPIPGAVLFTLTVSVQYYARWLYPSDRAAHYALLWAGYAPVYALLLGQLIWWKRRSGASRTP